MGKNFRNVSQLPDDFVMFDYMKKCPHIDKDIEETYGREKAEKLCKIVYESSFVVGSNMVRTREAVEAAAMKAIRENNEGACLDGITVEAPGPSWVSYCKDGKGFAWRECRIGVNEKYMEWDSEDGAYPLIPGKDGDENIGCSWIENGDPSWEDFERVEKALMENPG